MRPREPQSPSLIPRRWSGRGVTGGRAFARTSGPLALLLLGALLLVAPRAVAAQATPVAVTATIVTPLALSPLTQLDFGTVRRNRTTTIAVSDPGAGSLVLTGHAGAQVQLQWTLPTELTRLSGGSIPIGTWTGCHNQAQSPTTGCTTYTPSATPFVVTLTGGVRYFYIGASVSTTNATATGSYSGSIQLLAAYTGN